MLKVKIQNIPNFIINGVPADFADLQELAKRTERGSDKIIKRVNKKNKHYIYTI
jgi:hypothetical protein